MGKETAHEMHIFKVKGLAAWASKRRMRCILGVIISGAFQLLCRF